MTAAPPATDAQLASDDEWKLDAAAEMQEDWDDLVAESDDLLIPGDGPDPASA